MPNGWVKCPRCELNYIREGEEYCEVCKAELRKGPELIFAIDDEDVEETMDLCPRCHHNYIKDGESMCEECRKELEREPDEADDETWKEYLDDEHFKRVSLNEVANTIVEMIASVAEAQEDSEPVIVADPAIKTNENGEIIW